MARERKKPEEANELRWLTTYGDVVTLLLAFFVMLYAISQVDQQNSRCSYPGLRTRSTTRQSRRASSIRAPVLSAPTLATDRKISIPSDPLHCSMVFLKLQQIDDAGGVFEDNQPAEPNDNIDEDPGAGGVDPDALVTNEQLVHVRDAIGSALEAAGLDAMVDFEINSRGLVIAIATDHVLFASGSAEFGSNGEAIIAAIAPTLATFNNEILRGGAHRHSSAEQRRLRQLEPVDGPSTGRAQGFDRLGWYRSGPSGCDGLWRVPPTCNNGTEEGKAANRRVELVVVVERGESNG